MPTSVMIRDDPPDDTSGSGTPVTGSEPEHHGDVDARLADDPGADPGRGDLHEGIAVALRRCG